MATANKLEKYTEWNKVSCLAAPGIGVRRSKKFTALFFLQRINGSFLEQRTIDMSICKSKVTKLIV